MYQNIVFVTCTDENKNPTETNPKGDCDKYNNLKNSIDNSDTAKKAIVWVFGIIWFIIIFISVLYAAIKYNPSDNSLGGPDIFWAILIVPRIILFLLHAFFLSS